MNNYSTKSLQQALLNQVRRLEEKIKKLEHKSSRLSTWRLLTFIGGLVICYFSAKTGSPWMFGFTVFAFVVGFAYLVRLHRQITDQKEIFSVWKEIRQKHLGRSSLDWEAIPAQDHVAESDLREHSFGPDLNIIGSHSLHRLMDTTIYKKGSEKLQHWLLETEPDIKDIQKRHKLVKELKSLAYFRDRLELNANRAKSQKSKYDWSMDELLQWLRLPQTTNYGPAMLLLSSLSAVNIILGLLWLFGVIDPYIIISFVIYLIAYNFNTEKVKGLFASAYQMEKLLSRFSSILLYLEQYPCKNNTELHSFCSMYHNAETRPSRYLNKVVRLASAAALQKSQIGWILVNGIVPWDLYFARRMDKLKEDLEPRLTKWMDRFYELEALCSMANFAWLNPDYTFHLPEDNSPDAPFKATALGHPLIPKDQKVTNDITIDSVGNILLITGSNMAGKSTFLRTVGINLALCFAGAPVNAQSFQTIPYRLFTSINVKDSLDQGLSHFYAEVKRLRKLMDELNNDHPYPLFFFVDEIYKGTNNRERLIGSEAFLKQVAGRNGIGMVSTHDLELAQLEEEIPQLSNWHFEETIESGKMSFEYKLKPGPCPTTNALKIMEMEGLPV